MPDSMEAPTKAPAMASDAGTRVLGMAVPLVVERRRRGLNAQRAREVAKLTRAGGAMYRAFPYLFLTAMQGWWTSVLAIGRNGVTPTATARKPATAAAY